MEYEFEIQDYVQAVDAAETRPALLEATKLLEEVGREAQRCVQEMSEADFQEFRTGLPKERSGEWQGEAYTRRFGEILLPRRSVDLLVLAKKYQVPFGTAYNQHQRFHEEPEKDESMHFFRYFEFLPGKEELEGEETLPRIKVRFKCAGPEVEMEKTYESVTSFRDFFRSDQDEFREACNLIQQTMAEADQ